MEDWKLKCQERLLTEFKRNNRIRVDAMLEELIKERRSFEEIKAWFEAIPDEYWLQTEDNVFHVAAYVDNYEVIKNLVSAGYSDFNNKNCSSDTPLSVALKANNLKAAEALLDVGANIKTANQLKQTPLHLVAELQAGAKKFLKRFIDMGAYLNAFDIEQKTPLYYALACGNLAAAKILVDSGASIQFSDIPDFSPLHAAVKNKNSEMIDFLLTLETDDNLLEAREDYYDYERDQEGIYRGLTCLQTAALIGEKDLAIKLMKYGANPYVKNYTGYDILYYASCFSNNGLDQISDRRELLKMLLTQANKRFFRPDVKHKVFCKILFIADEEIVRLFIAKCDIDLPDYDKPYHELIDNITKNKDYGHKLLKFFSEHGRLHAHMRAEKKYSFFQYAIFNENLKCMKFFLKRYEKIQNRCFYDENSPLEVAINKCSGSCVRLLLSFGANVNIKGQDLPLYSAVRNRQIAIQKNEPINRIGDIIRTLVRYIAFGEERGIKMSEENDDLIQSHNDLLSYYNTCREDLVSMKEHTIHNSISFYDVFLDAKHYCRNPHVIRAFENPDALRTFGVYSDLLMERFERARKRPIMILYVQPVLMRLLKNDSRLYNIISPLVFKYLSNKDLRRLMLV